MAASAPSAGAPSQGLNPDASWCFMGNKSGEDSDEEEESPSCLNTNKCGHFLVISMDKLTVKYVGEGRHGNDVGAVQANKPAPSKRPYYYYEMNVIDRGRRGTVSIGFADESFKTSRQPGWEKNSYGYHGDDGKLYYGPYTYEAFGPTFTTSDTVGAGINHLSQELFFTKNGKLVGKKRNDVKQDLYPTIGLHSTNEKVTLNFGQTPYVFDAEAFIQGKPENIPERPASL